MKAQIDDDRESLEMPLYALALHVRILEIFLHHLGDAKSHKSDLQKLVLFHLSGL
jgi:hypothetical protein